MPIVVEEVVISVDISNRDNAGAGGGAQPSPGGGASESDRQQLVNECVERVLQLLAAREER